MSCEYKFRYTRDLVTISRDQKKSQRSLKERHLITPRTEVFLWAFRINLGFWETAHIPLPQVNINTDFSLRAKCWVRGAVGGQFPRNLNWSSFPPIFMRTKRKWDSCGRCNVLIYFSRKLLSTGCLVMCAWFESWDVVRACWGIIMASE